jgi:hypothetical protein
LQLSAPQGGTAQLTLQQATPGAVYGILESTNLTNWVLLETNSANSGGILQFNDTTATNTYRFYKAQAE